MCHTQYPSCILVYGRRSLPKGWIHRTQKANYQMRMGQLCVIHVRMRKMMVHCSHPGMLICFNTLASRLHRSTNMCGLEVWPQTLSPKCSFFQGREHPSSMFLKLDPHGVGSPDPMGDVPARIPEGNCRGKSESAEPHRIIES